MIYMKFFTLLYVKSSSSVYLYKRATIYNRCIHRAHAGIITLWHIFKITTPKTKIKMVKSLIVIIIIINKLTNSFRHVRRLGTIVHWRWKPTTTNGKKKKSIVRGPALYTLYNVRTHTKRTYVHRAVVKTTMITIGRLTAASGTRAEVTEPLRVRRTRGRLCARRARQEWRGCHVGHVPPPPPPRARIDNLRVT